MVAMAEVPARAKVVVGGEEREADQKETVVAMGAKVAVAVAEPAALEGKTWVCERKCRSFRNCRGFRRIGIRHCTRIGPPVPDLSRKREAPPPRPSICARRKLGAFVLGNCHQANAADRAMASVPSRW